LHGGLEELAEKYDAFLIDQWGVMHDGKKAYAKTVECMAKLAERGKKIVLLSNSSRRRGNSMSKLDKMGFDSKTIIDVVTSGEMGWRGISTPAAERRPPFNELEGNKVFVFGNGEEDEEYVKSAGLEFAEIEEADFILARGMFTMHDSTDVLFREGENKCNYWEKEATRSLQIASQTQKPMIVTNPDFVRPDGNNSPMPGQVHPPLNIHTCVRILSYSAPTCFSAGRTHHSERSYLAGSVCVFVCMPHMYVWVGGWVGGWVGVCVWVCVCVCVCVCVFVFVCQHRES
jgi:ribonucleotide monophosphatase NagD (HAD superfamily)